MGGREVATVQLNSLFRSTQQLQYTFMPTTWIQLPTNIKGGLPNLFKLHVTCNMSEYTPNPQGFNVVPEVWANTVSAKKQMTVFPFILHIHHV